MKKQNKNRDPERGRKGLTGKQTVLVVVCCVLALVLLLMVLGTAYMEHLLGLINRETNDGTLSSEEYQELLEQWATEDVDPTAPTLDPEDVIWGDEANKLENKEEVINILLIGQDRRPGEPRQRSDAMILCTINTKTKTLTMTSFMRDMYVQIPGYQDNKINACYQLKGMELLNDCLEVNFGVQVDGNVEVDFGGFQDVIDLLGGVDIKLSAAEADHLNYKYGYSLTEGVNKLTGEEALNYSRIRYLGDGDFERTSRQRTVIAALVESSRGMSLLELSSIVKEILPMVTTDMTNAEILDYIITLFPILSDLQINTQRIPADGTFSYNTIRGMSVLVPNLEKNRQLLQDTIGG